MDIEYEQVQTFSEERTFDIQRRDVISRDQYLQTQKIDQELERARQYGEMILSFINQEVTPIFTSNLIQMPLLKLNLDLSRQNWGNQELNIFCQSLDKITTLKNLNLNFAHNGIQDSGSIELSRAVSCLKSLESIEIDLQRNGLCKKAFAVLESLNQLSQVQKISLDVRGNSLELEDEMKQLLPKFKNEGIFSNLLSFNVSIDEVKQNESRSVPQITPEQAHLEKVIANFSTQIQQLVQAAGQYSHSPAHQQQFQMQANMINSQLQMAQAQLLKLQAEAQKNKKSGICRILEIILKFTTNLQQCALVMPGQLFTAREWEFLGTLLRNKPQSMTSFSFEGLNHNSHCQEMEYCFYQIGKLKGLTQLSLSLQNLKASNAINLSRFLSDLPALKLLKVDLSSPDALTQQLAVYFDLASLIKSSKQIQELSLSLGNSLIDDNVFSSIANSISSLKSLNSLQISLKNSNDLTDSAIASLIGLITISSLNSLSLDLSTTNFSSKAIVALFQAIAVSKANILRSLILNFIPLNAINRRQPFTKEESFEINSSLAKMQILKKCVISIPRNPLLSTFKEKAAQKNRMIKCSQMAKQSAIFQVLRKDIAFQVFEFLI